MVTMDISEAEIQLLSLLDQVERGEEVLITRHGRTVARLVPAETIDRERLARVVAQMKEQAQGQTLGGLSIKELRDEGRR